MIVSGVYVDATRYYSVYQYTEIVTIFVMLSRIVIVLNYAKTLARQTLA